MFYITLCYSAHVESHKGPCLGLCYLLHTSLPHPTLHCCWCWSPPICGQHWNVRCTISNWYQHNCFQPSKLSHSCTPIVQSEWSGNKSWQVTGCTFLNHSANKKITDGNQAGGRGRLPSSYFTLYHDPRRHARLTFNDHVQNVCKSAQYHII